VRMLALPIWPGMPTPSWVSRRCNRRIQLPDQSGALGTTAADEDYLVVDAGLWNRSPWVFSLVTGKVQGIWLENDCQ
jgi:hypothetical protein